MTDIVERRFQAVADKHDDSNWDEVRRRARRGPTRRVALLAATAVVAVAVAAPASGLHEPIIDFFTGDPAPERVRRDFETFDSGAPRGMAPGVIPGESRQIVTARLSDGPHTLWVAPTEAGGFCTYWSGMTAGCDRLGTVPLSLTYGGQPFAVTGHADADYVHSVEARYADGRAEPVDVTWVGPPIDAGFFAYEPGGAAPDSLVGLDSEGGVVTTHPVGRGGRETALADAVLGQKAELRSVEAGDATARLWTAPTRYEGRCAWVEYQGKRYSAARCGPKGYSWTEGVGLGLVELGGDYFLLGTAGPRFAPLELRLADGRRVDVEPIDDVVFAKLPTDVTTGDSVTIVPAGAADDPKRHLVLPVQHMFD
jgi:hypothetical protein